MGIFLVVLRVHRCANLPTQVVISAPCRFVELSGRIVGEAFYTGELESQLRRIKRAEYRFRLDSDRDSCMEMVEKERCASVYAHPEDECTRECKARGSDCSI